MWRAVKSGRFAFEYSEVDTDVEVFLGLTLQEFDTGVESEDGFFRFVQVVRTPNFLSEFVEEGAVDFLFVFECEVHETLVFDEPGKRNSENVVLVDFVFSEFVFTCKSTDDNIFFLWFV